MPSVPFGINTPVMRKPRSCIECTLRGVIHTTCSYRGSRGNTYMRLSSREREWSHGSRMELVLFLWRPSWRERARIVLPSAVSRVRRLRAARGPNGTCAPRLTLCLLHALPGFGQPFGQRGVLGAMARPAPVSPLFNTPSIHHPTHTHRYTENTAIGQSSISHFVCLRAGRALHPRWPKRTRCWPHAFWQSCTTPGRLGVLSNNANPIADNGAPRRHARF